MRRISMVLLRGVLAGLPAGLLAGLPASLLFFGPAEAAAAQAAFFELKCNANDEVLVGIRGRQGWWMDGIAARCRSLGSNGALGDRVRTTAYRGGSGGTQKTYDCGRQEVMVGYSGTRGDNGYVQSVHEIICAPWDASTRTAGTPTRARSAFERKPGSWIAGSCFQGRVGTGLHGRAGTYLDALSGMFCGYAPGAAPPTVSQPAPPPPRPLTTAPVPIEPSGTYNVAPCADPPNPLFSWRPVAGATAYIVEFRNDSRGEVRTSQELSTRTAPGVIFRDGERYRWRVRATNALGNGPWSPYLSFTAERGNYTTPCVVRPSPIRLYF